jgi:hypothetical protein
MPSYFDQRGQRVTHQVNVVGTASGIDFSEAADRATLVAQLERLKSAMTGAAERGDLPPEQALDADYQVAKALHQAGSPTPDGGRIVGHLTEARSVLTATAAAAGIVTAIGQAIEAVQRLF